MPENLSKNNTGEKGEKIKGTGCLRRNISTYRNVLGVSGFYIFLQVIEDNGGISLYRYLISDQGQERVLPQRSLKSHSLNGLILQVPG